MLDKVLFQIGSFEVTVLVVVLVALLIVLLVAAMAFRQNYIIQVRLSRLMDAESAKHNHEGFVTLLRKRKKKILKNSRQVSPAIVIFSLDNLGGVYVGYKNQRLLMRTISDVFTEGLKKQEFVTRIDFSKFGLIVTDRNREEVKEFILKCIERLNEIEFPKGYRYEDVEFFYKILPYIEKYDIVKKAFVHYIQRENSISNVQNSRTKEIVFVLNNVINYYKQNNLYEEYKNELEYIYARYILCSSMLRMVMIEDKKERKKIINFAWESLNENFPEWKKSLYLNKKGTKNLYMKTINYITLKVYSQLARCNFIRNKLQEKFV